MKRWFIAGSCVLLTMAAPPVQAQTSSGTGRLTGTITEAKTGQPISGARVTVEGANVGAVTGSQGNYSIVVPAGVYQVKASMIGYQPTTIDKVNVTEGAATTASFQMERSLTVLGEVVVTGYGTQQRRDVTGAVASVDAEQINQNKSVNAIEAIKGRVPGVDIVSTGYKPGDGVRVRIRGTRSIKASNDPLYVLDGIPMAGGIGDLNQSDIQSIEILKDASATAIYGSRGANGVVLITTRRGSAGRTKITYNTYAGSEVAAKKMRVFNGAEFIEYKREAYRASGDYAKYCGTQQVCAAGDSATFSYAEEYKGFLNGTSTDWIGLISQTGSQVQNELSVTGGNDRTQYAMTGNLQRQDGIIRGQDYDKKSMRLNFETQANSRLRFGGSAMVLRSTQDLGRGDGEYGEAMAVVPIAAAYDSTGSLIFRPTPDPQRVNPAVEIKHYFDQRNRTRAFGTLYGSANLTEGLDYRINFGPDITYFRRGQFRGAKTQAFLGTGSDANLWNERTFDYTLDNILTYRRDIGADHKFDITGLYSVEKQTFEEDSSKGSNLPYESQLYWNLGSAATIEAIGSRITQWALQSYMARVNYSFRDRYLATLTTRVDGSSRLAPGKKYATFPSVGLGWRIIDPAFSSAWGPIGNLKLRASYGLTGNTSVSPYETQGGLTRSIYSFGTGAAYGYRPGSLPNPDLRWEKTAQFDAGADFNLFDNKVSGTLDVYRAKTTDLIMDRKLPPATGYTQITQNIGSTRNYGVELALSHNTLQGWHGVTWTNDVNVAVARNEIVSLTYGAVSDPGNHWFIGYPIDGGGNDVWYDYKKIGIWQTADSALAAKYKAKPGDIRVQDVNGDTLINTNDLQILGNTYPKWTGSYNTSVLWKRLDFAMQVITRNGFMLNNTFKTSNSTLAGRYNGLKVDYWTPTNPTNSDPRPNKNSENPTFGGTRGYEVGSFTRVRNITVGFAVPDRYLTLSRTGAESMRIYATAQNPFTFTKFTGLDPEGRASAGSPSYKMYLIGATFGF